MKGVNIFRLSMGIVFVFFGIFVQVRRPPALVDAGAGFIWLISLSLFAYGGFRIWRALKSMNETEE